MQNYLEQNKLVNAISPELQRKKNAIYHALCTILSDEEAEAAVSSWMQNFSGSASAFIGLNLFAREVCKTYGKHERQRELVQALSRALLIKEVGQSGFVVSTPTTPLKIIPEPEESTEVWAETAVDTPEFASFQAMILIWLDALTHHNAQLVGQCEGFLLGVIDALPWSPAQQEQVIKLIKNRTTVQTRTYRTGQLKTFVHHLTVWMQDTLGVEVGDGIVRLVIAAASNTAAGMAYSPQEFFPK